MSDKSDIIFVEETHQYFKDGKELISASTLVSKYRKPFDKNGIIIKRCADRDGKTVEQLRSEWDKIRDDASARGNSFHSQAQYWVQTGKIKDGDYKDVVEKLAKLPFKGKLSSERKVYNVKLGIAGTIDLTSDLGNGVKSIFDFKTNKKLKKTSFWDKETRQYQMMLPPISHIQCCNLNHYYLQLWIYQIIEEENGFFVKNAKILYINPKSREIEIYPVINLRAEAMTIIKHYHAKNNW